MYYEGYHVAHLCKIGVPPTKMTEFKEAFLELETMEELKRQISELKTELSDAEASIGQLQHDNEELTEKARVFDADIRKVLDAQ